MKLGEDLAWVHQRCGIERAFDMLLLVEIRLVEHDWHQVALFDADAVLSGQDAPDFDAQPQDVRTELFGATLPTMTPHVYTPHDAALPLQLQGRARVRYRNVWIRPLKPNDQGATVN